MYGGELIATGSDSCVFVPNFPCKRDGKVDDNRVSKIIYSEGAEEDSQYEKEMNEKIQKIKGYSSWAIIFNQYCKPLPKDILMEYDRKGMGECLGNDSYLHENFDYHSYMMNGVYGGETMEDYFDNMIPNQKMNPNQRDKLFLHIMTMMEPLFLGLKKMKENKIVHNDIKQNNIVVHDGVFKFIDFGLAGTLSDKQHFKQRSLDELNTARIYLYYPLEYLLFYASRKQLDDELVDVHDKNKQRYNYEYLDAIHSMFNLSALDIYYGTAYQIREKKVNEKKMIQGIDVYSLGMLVPLLLIGNRNIFKDESQIIVDFYNLFGKMIQPLSENRISAENAYKEFKSLLNKYKKGIPKKKKSRMKRVKRRTIGKKTVVKRGKKKVVKRGRKKTDVKRKKKTIRRGSRNLRA